MNENMILNLGGSGGAPLNFKVVGGTVQPANPKENTIWVDTDAEITGWTFSATQPETAQEGEVWIKTGAINSIEFNALKKNSLHVYPMNAKQYVDGVWTPKTALLYQNSVWRNFYTYLYDHGTEYPHIANFTDSRDSNGTVTRNDSDITMALNGTTASIGHFAVTDVSMDLSQFNTIAMKLSGTTSYGGFTGFGVSAIVPEGSAMNRVAHTDVKTKIEQENFGGLYTCDISAVDSGYIFFGTTKAATGAAAGSGYVKLSECYLY